MEVLGVRSQKEIGITNHHHTYYIVAVLHKPFEMQVGRFIIPRHRGISKWLRLQNVELWWNHTLFVQCPKLSEYIILAGGWTNPSEKYIRQINQFPNFAVETKKTWNHHVVICWISSAPTTKGSYSKPSELTVFGFMRKVRLSVHCTPQKINGFFT